MARGFEIEKKVVLMELRVIVVFCGSSGEKWSLEFSQEQKRWLDLAWRKTLAKSLVSLTFLKLVHLATSRFDNNTINDKTQLQKHTLFSMTNPEQSLSYP